MRLQTHTANIPELRKQLAVKTSSSKKRKISTRQSTAKDQGLDTNSPQDIPLQSCEQDSDPSFSFSASSVASFSTAVEPAYLRPDSLPPASSLPPRLQTSNTSNTALPTYTEYASSAASSPSGAYADLSIHSDRGGDTPAPDASSVASNNQPSARGTSPFTKPTYHRVMMGGAADFPDRASSPLKRRASSMDPEAADQDGNEDVDMITAPPSEAKGTSKSEIQAEETDSVLASQHDTVMKEQSPTAGEEVAPAIATSSDVQPPASIEAHVNEIRSLVDAADNASLTDGQICYLVSRRWLANVPDTSSSKHTLTDLSSIPPVDNSDIILEVISDPCVGGGLDVLKKKFVRLKEKYDTEQFQPFPPTAWALLMQWPGLKEDGQLPIIRTAHDNSREKLGLDVMWEWHPPVFSIQRLWSARSTIPVEASLKASNPRPGRLVRSRQTPFQTFLKQAKMVARIDLKQRVRAWNISPTPQGAAPNNSTTVPTPPASPDNSGNQTGPWDSLLLDAVTFSALKDSVGTELIPVGDLSDKPEGQMKTDLAALTLIMDQTIVIDPHEGGSQWTSLLGDESQEITSLPTRNSSANLNVQNKNARSGRTSPVSQGPLTRGRAQRSGRTLGSVGLGNLGNTCYMNAALQCLRSVEELTKYFLSGEWEKELNAENPLAHNGDVAASFATLLKEIYRDPPPNSVTPRQFKNVVSKYAVNFAGYGQQDTQEFLGWLLDGLQEDLSRVKKKPYIEKPDSTDEMLNDPEAIRQMADEVWGITKKRDDSVVADLFTGLYKSTLVCPDCGKISITFDPFNNLTLQLPVESKFNHTVKFVPLNDRPIDIRIEVEKHASIKAVKEFVSARTGVPVERLFGSEEWKGKFYKHYADLACASEEIGANDNAWIFELEAKPTNYGGKPQKQQQLGVSVKSLVDEEEHNASASWDDPQAEKLLVPVFHRRRVTGRQAYHTQRFQEVCPPHFIVVSPQEARSEDAIRRKILEKVATFTKHPVFQEEPDGSDGTEPELIGPNGSDTGSTSEGRVVAQSVKGEDDMVDVQMQDATDAKGNTRSNLVKYRYNHKRPAWVDPNSFLQPELQNLFDLYYYAEGNTWLPTGMSGFNDDKEFPKLDTRAPPESSSSEDQFDNATNGTASNEDSSSDEASRQSTDTPQTRMNDESEEEDSSPVVKSQPMQVRSKQSRQPKPRTKAVGGRGKKGKKQQKTYGKGSKKAHRQQRQLKEKQQTFEAEDSFDMPESFPDGGPLIRLKEGIVVEWSELAYGRIFNGDEGSHNERLLATWDDCDTLPAPDLDKMQAARSKRRKNGLSLETCLDEFERDEILSEQDMWYCPRCKDHRRASKKFDLWKTPDILIIHLKRFSSSGWKRDKLETVVDFPIENLDITDRVLERVAGKQEVYDLIGIDSHYGGLGGGHYTASAKNFVNGQWYSYNDSSVSKASGDRLVDSSAYLLFYRRRSDVPLGGPHFGKILDQFKEDDTSDAEAASGEGQRLGEGFSQTGSSSALEGAEVTHLHENPGGNSSMNSILNGSENTTYATGTRSDDDVPLLANTGFQEHRGNRASVEEDEGIDLSEDMPQSTGFHPLTGNNSWNFENLNERTMNNDDEPDSPLGSDAATNEAQHDSGDDRVLSPRTMEFDPDLEDEFPGMSHYELPPQPEREPPSYNEPPRPGYHTEMTRDDMRQIWDQKNKMIEVPAEGEDEQRSEDAAEIHLDD